MRVDKQVEPGYEELDFQVRTFGSLNNKPGCMVRIRCVAEVEELRVRYADQQIRIYNIDGDLVCNLVLAPSVQSEVALLRDGVICSMIREGLNDRPSINVIFAL